MFEQNSFSLDSFDQDSWLFLLETAYADLSHHQRVYVTAVVESLYAQFVADQIVSVAAQNNLSVMDAIQVVTAKHEGLQLAVLNARKVSSENPVRYVRSYAPKQDKHVANPNVYSITEDKSIVACFESDTEFVFSHMETLTVSAETNQIFIQHKPKRSALEQNGV